MVKITEKQIDAKIDELATKFKEAVSKEPSSMMERFMKIAMGQEPDRMPMFMQIHDHAAKVAGVSVRDICTDPKKLLYAQLFAAVKYGFDFVAQFADSYTFEVEALGAKMLYPEDSFPVVVEPLVKEKSDLKKLKVPDFTKDGRGPVIIQTNKLFLEKLGQYAFPICIASAPWSMAVHLRGFNNLVRDTRKDPEFAHQILDFCNDVLEALVNVQRKTIGDIPAMPVLADAFSCIPPTSPQLVYDYVIPHTAALIKRLGPMMWAGGYPIMETPNWEKIFEDTITMTGAMLGIVAMLESDWLPPEKIKELSKRINKPFIFGIRAGYISSCTPKELEERMKYLIKVLAPGGGCMVMVDQIPRDTPPENVQTYVNTIKKYGKYPISIK